MCFPMKGWDNPTFFEAETDEVDVLDSFLDQWREL